MSVFEPAGAVLWLTDITRSQAEIKVALSAPLYEYGRQRANGLAYAKYAVSEHDGWTGVAGFFCRHGETIRRLIASGAIGAATLDLMFVFPQTEFREAQRSRPTLRRW